MERHTSSKRSAQVHEVACEWFVEFRAGEPSEAQRKAFLAWLQESPAHMGAYLEVTGLWNDTAAVNRDRRWTIDELIQQAAREPDNVIALEGALSTMAAARVQPTGSQREATGSSHRTRLWIYSAAASILFLVFAGLMQWYLQRGTYSTDIGEQRSLTLADGSTVLLNARSKLRVRFTANQRRIELIRGQALFQVAKEASRPFIVASADTRVRAVGTQFDVYQKQKGTVVTVLEGRVAVFSSRAEALPSIDFKTSSGTSGQNSSPQRSDPAPQPIFVSAGQQLALTDREQKVSRPANLAAATAWTQRQLVFESTPLSEVADEFNRYNEQQVVIRDPRLEDFQIDGVFSSTDPASLIRFLRTRPEVQVTETSSAIILDRLTKLP